LQTIVHPGFVGSGVSHVGPKTQALPLKHPLGPPPTPTGPSPHDSVQPCSTPFGPQKQEISQLGFCGSGAAQPVPGVQGTPALQPCGPPPTPCGEPQSEGAAGHMDSQPMLASQISHCASIE
jgi:hypothetical protein